MDMNLSLQKNPPKEIPTKENPIKTNPPKAPKKIPGLEPGKDNPRNPQENIVEEESRSKEKPN